MIDIGYAGALLGGVATIVSPCSAVLLPAFFAYAFASRTALLGRSLLFFAGLLTTLVPLGVAASSVGRLFAEHRPVVVAVASGIVIVLGLLQVLGVPLPLPGRIAGGSGGDPGSAVAVYLLGAVYGVAGVCSGPILGSVLAVAAVKSNLLYGGLLLGVYALGMVLPVMVLAALWEAFDLGRRAWLRPRPLTLGPIHTNLTSVISGTIFVAIGLLLLLTDGTTNLGGVLSIDDQFRSEAAIQSWSSAIPDLAVILVITAIAVATVLIGGRDRAQDSRREEHDTGRLE